MLPFQTQHNQWDVLLPQKFKKLRKISKLWRNSAYHIFSGHRKGLEYFMSSIWCSTQADNMWVESTSSTSLHSTMISRPAETEERGGPRGGDWSTTLSPRYLSNLLRIETNSEKVGNSKKLQTNWKLSKVYYYL